SQTATLRFENEIGKGDRVLEITWNGEIREALRGLYRSTRPGERYAATQFEAADARRAYPCFDEPEFKARFALELIHPAGLAAIANMPIEKTEAIADGRVRTRFVETPKISPYLLAFTVGPYESTEEARTPSGVPTRVWLPPGLAEQGIYARDAHVRSLSYLEKYTDIPYPYIKVDAIGIPDFEAGAMENPGAITYTKGAAVLRMIEGYLGEDVFREGVRSYLRRYAEANASADDFWRELDAASGQDVTKIANAWIKEPGHPLVESEARESDGGLEITLTQSRYFSDADAKPTGQLWPVPLVIRYGARDGTKEKRMLLTTQRATLRLEGARWFYPNAGGRGFYRFKLTGISAGRLDEGIARLSAEERLILIDNLWALTRHGKATLGQFIRRLETLRGEEDRAVIQAISEALNWIANYAVREATDSAF